jgi:hypothetical protein
MNYSYWLFRLPDGLKYQRNRLFLMDVIYVIAILYSRTVLEATLANAPLPMCHLCSKPVELETAKTDEGGRAVHEECYLRKIRSKTELSDST